MLLLLLHKLCEVALKGEPPPQIPLLAASCLSPWGVKSVNLCSWKLFLFWPLGKERHDIKPFSMLAVSTPMPYSCAFCPLSFHFFPKATGWLFFKIALWDSDSHWLWESAVESEQQEYHQGHLGQVALQNQGKEPAIFRFFWAASIALQSDRHPTQVWGGGAVLIQY